MPLLSLGSTEAVANRKGNPFAGWGARGAANRVEPVAAPHFEAPFKLAPGQSIFTIGSCFARNVEAELAARGFDIPVRRIFERPEFQGVELQAINNYGTPSIHNEIAWALGGKTFDEAANFIEVAPGKFADLHLTPTLRPESLEIVRRRRAAILAATRLLPDCAAMVVTLGLVEVWRDNGSGEYLNVAPRPQILRQDPERFSLHVLSYEECLHHLRSALDIVYSVARPEFRVILTVSPVPLTSTHTADDVIVANGYSKAVLRTVAETIRRSDPRVVYFPSYESVVLSDRKLAWEDDLIHVTGKIVSFNVGRMVAAFVEGAETGAPASEAEAVEAARRARDQSDMTFFETYGDWSARSAQFAVEHAGLLKVYDVARALEVLAGAPQDSEQVTVLRAQLLTDAGRAGEAVGILRPMCHAGSANPAAWAALLKAHSIAGDKAGLVESGQRWVSLAPRRAGFAQLHLGRGLRRLGDLAGAKVALELALRSGRDDPYYPGIELARLYNDMGDAPAARAIIEELKPQTDAQSAALARLMRRFA